MSLPAFPLLILTLLWPLLITGLIAWQPARQQACRLAPWAALPALLLAVVGTPGESLYLPWFLLGTELGMDHTGQVFLLLTALLWWLAAWYGKAYLPAGEHPRFFSFFNLAMLGNVGLILAQDMLSFYLFFTLMSFAAYGLIIHAGTAAAIHAGKIYMTLVVIGEVALFAALVLVAVIAETLSFDVARPLIAQADSHTWILLLALLGFGIKAGMIVLHVWLPLAHPVAPTPASAVLSGAMIKAGLLGWLRLLPLGEAMLYSWGALFITLGLMAAFYAVLVGLMQRDAKTLLAYSSISQMGIMTAAIGLGLMVPAAWSGILAAILIYALHHGLAKGTLFLGVGILSVCAGKQWQRAWMALWLPAMALAGAPFTSGMVAKSLLKVQAIHAPEFWSMLFQFLLPCSAIATALLLGKFLLLLIQTRHSKKLTMPAAKPMLVPWLILLLSVATLPWWPYVSQTGLWSRAILFSSLWPVVLALLIMLASVTRTQWLPTRPMAASQHGRWQALATLHIPAGDILLPLERGISKLLSLANHLFSRSLPRWCQSVELELYRIRSGIEWQQHNEKLESFLGKWVNALIFFISLGLFMAWFAWPW